MNEQEQYILSVDPGKQGAIVIMDLHGDIVEMLGMPLVGKKEYDHRQIANILEQYPLAHVAIEDPISIFGVSKNSVASLRECVGFFHGLVIGMKVPYSLLKPKIWQKVMWNDVTKQMKPSSTGKTQVVDTKATSIIAINRLYPHVDFKVTNNGNPSKNYNDGMVDAALMCKYIQFKYGSN